MSGKVIGITIVCLVAVLHLRPRSRATQCEEAWMVRPEEN